MTPAIKLLQSLKVTHHVHTYDVPFGDADYGQRVADALGVSHDNLFKTLVVKLNDDIKQILMCVIPVSSQLNLKSVAKVCRAKRAELVDPATAERITGYQVGGISPLGSRKKISVLIDSQANSLDTLYCSAGKRGLQIEINPRDLIQLANAQIAQLIA